LDLHENFTRDVLLDEDLYSGSDPYSPQWRFALSKVLLLVILFIFVHFSCIKSELL